MTLFLNGEYRKRVKSFIHCSSLEENNTSRHSTSYPRRNIDIFYKSSYATISIKVPHFFHPIIHKFTSTYPSIFFTLEHGPQRYKMQPIQINLRQKLKFQARQALKVPIGTFQKGGNNFSTRTIIISFALVHIYIVSMVSQNKCFA